MGKLDDIMLYLDFCLKPVVKFTFVNSHSFVQTSVCDSFMRTAVDLGNTIFHDHFQPLETSMEYLGRQAQSL